MNATQHTMGQRNATRRARLIMLGWGWMRRAGPGAGPADAFRAWRTRAPSRSVAARHRDFLADQPAWSQHQHVGDQHADLHHLQGCCPRLFGLRNPGADGDDARTLLALQAAAITYAIAFGPRAGQKVSTLRGARAREGMARELLCSDIDGSACTRPSGSKHMTASGWSNCAATSPGRRWQTRKCSSTMQGRWNSSKDPLARRHHAPVNEPAGVPVAAGGAGAQAEAASDPVSRGADVELAVVKQRNSEATVSYRRRASRKRALVGDSLRCTAILRPTRLAGGSWPGAGTRVAEIGAM